MRLLNQQNKRAIVNLTPLIDVVFILLIFFMLASSFAEWQYTELAVGEAEEMRVNSLSSSVIKLKPNEVYELNDKQMEVSEIIAVVKQRCLNNAEHPVVIQPYEGVALQFLVALLGELNKFAEKNISLAKAEI